MNTAAERPFQLGDVVRLASGSLPMTVTRADPDGSAVCCIWMDRAGAVQRGEFIPEALRLGRVE
jgi:uncharacterized protein YodC (DUF2158 family)